MIDPIAVDFGYVVLDIRGGLPYRKIENTNWTGRTKGKKKLVNQKSQQSGPKSNITDFGFGIRPDRFRFRFHTTPHRIGTDLT